MDKKKQLLFVLNEIGEGRIDEGNVSFLKSYSNDRSKWLSFASSRQLFMVCESLKDFINSSGAKTLNLEVMILVLESYSQKKSGNPMLLLKHCLPAIFEFVAKMLERSKSKMKDREKSALRKILSSLTNLELPFVLYPKRLLKEIFLFVFNDVSDFDEYCLLLILSVPKTDTFSSFVIETVFEKIEGQTDKCKKTVTVEGAKMKKQFLFLIAYTQGLLGVDEKGAYEKSFRFTAHFVDCLYNKCGDKAFMTFAEDYLAFLISNANNPVWPVVPFILQLITKNLCCKLIDPETNARLQSFLIKQIPRIAERLTACETAKEEIGEDITIQDLKASLMAYIETLSRDYIKGDIRMAYRNLWAKYNFPDLDNEDIKQGKTKDPALAATILEQLLEGHATSIECLKLLLKCSDNPNKMVKTNAVKALGKVILLKPSYLSILKVQAVLGDCLESLNASGRLSIANMLAVFLASEPALTEKFIHYFVVLLSDDAFTVRRSAINAVGEICAADYFHGMEGLTTKILLLFHDPELAVQNAVLDFFSTVFVNRVSHLGCLVEINVNANIRSLMGPIFKQLRQVKSNLNDELALLAEAVILYLKTSSVERKKLAAGVVLEALAQVYPSSLVNQFPDILKLLFNDQKEPYLMKKLCRVLISASELINEDDRVFIYKSVKKIISKNFDWNKLSPCVLELLMVLSKFATENIFDRFIQPSLDMINQSMTEGFPRCDIALPLSIVAFLWKDYENNEQVTKMLMDFLRHPSYQKTVLSALTEARLESVPERANPILNSLINEFIRDMDKPHMVIAALKYLNNCLIGDEANYEKPEMKQLGDSTTASLSQLLQETLQGVLACTLQPKLGIRRSACGVIRHIVQSGLLLRSHFISYLVAMTADDCNEIRHAALESLKRMPETEVAIFAIEGIRIAYTLRKVLHPNSVVRGVVKETGNSVCHKTFELIHTAAKVRKLLENLVTEATKRSSIEEVVFVLDSVVFYPFKAANEVGHAVEILEKEIFKCRKIFHYRLLEMAKDCLEKNYKISPNKQKLCQDKLQRAAIKEYLDINLVQELEERGEESALALLICLEEDLDSEAEPERPLDDNIVDEELITYVRKSKGSKSKSSGKKRTSRKDSGRSKKRLCFSGDNLQKTPQQGAEIPALPQVILTDEDLNCSHGIDDLFNLG